MSVALAVLKSSSLSSIAGFLLLLLLPENRHSNALNTERPEKNTKRDRERGEHYYLCSLCFFRCGSLVWYTVSFLITKKNYNQILESACIQCMYECLCVAVLNIDVHEHTESMLRFEYLFFSLFIAVFSCM